MLHAQSNHARVYPWNSARQPSQIDRAIEITDDIALNSTKRYEIGRVGQLGTKKGTPTNTYALRQYENGAMAFFRDLANIVDPSTGESTEIDLDDIKATRCNYSHDYTDDAGTFIGSVFYPNMRLSGFSINVGDTEADIERNFSIVGEKYCVIPGYYVAYTEQTAVGATEVISFGGTGEPLTPVEYKTDTYMLMVLRVRSGVVSELTTSAYTYNAGTQELTVTGCMALDLIKVYYVSATAYTDLWEDNDVDPDAFSADQISIYARIGSGEESQLYRLQSIGIDVAFTRKDYRELGNKNVVQTGVSEKEVTVTLGGVMEDFTIEEVLSGEAAPKYIDTDELSTNVTIIVKIYTDNTKTTFAMEYKMTGLASSALSNAQPNNDYQTNNNTLIGSNFSVSLEETVFS
jgi:hypothetical protein